MADWLAIGPLGTISACDQYSADALLECGVVQLAMQPHPCREQFGLVGIGVQLEGGFAVFHDVVLAQFVKAQA